MVVDLSVNLPLIVTVVGVGAALVARFVRLEERLDGLVERLAEHTEQDEKRFEEVRRRFQQVAGEVQRLGLKDAELSGRLSQFER
jgi:hypothetical protein